MNPIKPKRKFLLLVLLIVFIVVVIIFLFLKSSNKINVNPTPIPQNGASYRNLIPGSSTEEDVLKNLGNPVKTGSNNGTKILEYYSKNPNFNNEILVNNNSLSFVKQIVTIGENIKIQDIINKYGNYENILYGPDAGVGFYLYIYSTKGIAYIGHQESGLIKEIWYFPPTSFESFKTKYAPSYASTIQIIQ